MENEEKLFKKKKGEKKEKISIQSLVEKITELNEILPLISDPIDEISMEYLSDLYSETKVPIKNITIYMVQNGYPGMNDSIDYTVLRTQELIGILKEFKGLNTSRKARGFIDKSDEAKASIFLQALKKKMGDLVALKKSTDEENVSLTQD